MISRQDVRSYRQGEQVYILWKVRRIDVIVDLTHREDTLEPYETDIHVVKFPIRDMSVSSDSNLCRLIEHLSKHIIHKQKIYIHCKGGHGRSGVGAACLYGYCYNKSGYDALMRVGEAHQNRRVMKSKWRRIGSPQTSSQVEQVFRFLDRED